jgi:MFS family permease
MGIFAGAYHPSSVSVLSTHIEGARRGKAIALHMVGGSIGYTFGPIFGGLIAELLGWRFAFIILSIPALVAIPLIFKKFRQQTPVNIPGSGNDSPAGDGTIPKPLPRHTGIFQVLRPLSIIFVLAISTQLIGGTALAFIPIYLVDKHYITPAYAAMLIGMTRGGGIAGSLFGGWLSDRWGRRMAIFLALGATGPTLYLLTRLPLNASLVIVLILFGLFMYMRQATVQPFLMDNVPPQLRATVFGIYFGLGMEGMSLLQPVAGYFMDIFGSVAVFNVIALISVALSLISLTLAKKPKL